MPVPVPVPVPVPGQHAVYYVTKVGESTFRLLHHDLDSNRTQVIYESTLGHIVRPTPSPDGRYIAFGQQDRKSGALDIFLFDFIDGQTERLTTTTHAFELQTLAGPATHLYTVPGGWLKTGSVRSDYQLVLATTQDLTGVQSRGVHLVHATLGERGTGALVRDFLQVAALGPFFPHQNVPTVSADQRKVAFWSGFEGNRGEVWTTLADGSGAVRHTTSDDGEPNCPGSTAPWTRPDCLCPPNDKSCWTNSDDPHWAPAGDKLVYGRSAGPDAGWQRDIHIVDLEQR